MRLVEIGDGMKSIKVSNNYYSEWEDNGTVILYDPENNFAEIRISTITVGPKDSSDTNFMFKRVIDEAKKKELKINIEDDKSYYNYIRNDDKNGLMIFFFEIGYLNHLFIISITASAEYCQNNEESIENLISEITGFIPSIKEIDIKAQNIFEPKYTDFTTINERISKILNIAPDNIDTFHNEGKTISLIQKKIDSKTFREDETFELESLGIALGDYIQHKYSDFHWAVMRDEYGRDICLQYKTFAITVYPMTMILKRIENGETVNLSELINNLIGQVTELSISRNYDELDHNN